MVGAIEGVGSTRAWPGWYCLEHHAGLTAESDRLVCPKGHHFPIVNEIPRFVGASNYTDHFGLQWNRYPRTQLDSYTGLPITLDRLKRCIGEPLWNNLPGKQVLECGCGAGRFTEVLLERGAQVTSIDLSSAVEANRRNFPTGPTHRIAQADILKLPFAPESFDVVICLGVIQHTPDSEKTIAALYSQVKPGGTLVIDHYRYHLGWYTKTAPIVRAWLKHRPPEKSLKVTEKLVDFFLPWHRRVQNVPIVRSIVHRISPILSYYKVYPEMNEELQYEWSLLDTHDYLTDWYKHFRTVGQIRAFLESLRLDNIWVAEGGNGVEARGTKPKV